MALVRAAPDVGDFSRARYAYPNRAHRVSGTRGRRALAVAPRPAAAYSEACGPGGSRSRRASREDRTRRGSCRRARLSHRYGAWTRRHLGADRHRRPPGSDGPYLRRAQALSGRPSRALPRPAPAQFGAATAGIAAGPTPCRSEPGGLKLVAAGEPAAHAAAAAPAHAPAAQDGALMRYLEDGCPVYTATDLCDYLACGHLVALKRRVAAGESIPSDRSALSEVLANLGARHEQRHLDGLRARGLRVKAFEDERDRYASTTGELRALEAETVEAMARGLRASSINRPSSTGAGWAGADFLLRVETTERPVALGRTRRRTQSSRAGSAPRRSSSCASTRRTSRGCRDPLPRRCR